jgi:hypothetical protein
MNDRVGLIGIGLVAALRNAKGDIAYSPYCLLWRILLPP